MGFLDELKDKVAFVGDKAKDGFEAAKDKASGLVDDVKDRMQSDEGAADKVGSVADAADVKVSDTAESTPETAAAATEAAREKAAEIQTDAEVAGSTGPTLPPASGTPESDFRSV